MYFHANASSYDAWVKALRKFPKLEGHIFLGVSAWTGEPILLPLALLFEHLWVTGGSGSGKTALILIPILAQLIEMKKLSVVYIDQKWDPASFWGLYVAAHKAGMPFKYFSMCPGDESYIYNPLRQETQKLLTPMQRAEFFTVTSGSDFAEGYGPSFFTGKQELVTGNIFSNYSDPPIEDFLELYRYFDDRNAYRNIGHIQDFEDASHIRSVLARLASISSLSATPQNLDKPSVHENAMDASELLKSPGVYYFKIPASAGKNASRYISRDFANNLFTRAGMRADSETTPVILAWDEFQVGVGPGLETFLEQCRSRGIYLIACHQALAQLQRGDTNFLPVMEACTSAHIVLEATEKDTVEYVKRRSGKAYFTFTSWSQEAPPSDSTAFYQDGFFQPWKAASADGLRSPLVNVREELGDRLDETSILRISADPQAAFIAVKKNKGFLQTDGAMIPMRCFFHIDKKPFEDRSKEPWPTWDRPETIIVKLTNSLRKFGDGDNGAAGVPVPAPVIPPPPGAAASLLHRLRSRTPGDK